MNSAIVDRIIIAIDSRGPIQNAFDVLQVAASAAAEVSSNTRENRVAVRTALIKVLSGPDGELYTDDDVLPEKVMRDLVDILQTDILDRLVDLLSTRLSLYTRLRRTLRSCFTSSAL